MIKRITKESFNKSVNKSVNELNNDLFNYVLNKLLNKSLYIEMMINTDNRRKSHIYLKQVHIITTYDINGDKTVRCDIHCDCPVCYNDCSKENLVILTCKHELCLKCTYELNDDNEIKCPMCRSVCFDYDNTMVMYKNDIVKLSDNIQKNPKNRPTPHTWQWIAGYEDQLVNRLNIPMPRIWQWTAGYEDQLVNILNIPIVNIGDWRETTLDAYTN